MTHDEKKALIVPSQSVSVRKQAKLLDISRASISYEPVIDAQDIEAMAKIDEIFTSRPFYGSRRVKTDLKNDYGIAFCRDHIRRLMRVMGLEAIYPKSSSNTSIPDNRARKYPYLLRGMTAKHPNHIWGTDITYIRLAHGWCYLTAILDWFSRYVVGWRISPTLESGFCREAMHEALVNHGTPDISNSDQGSQYTDREFTGLLEANHVRISMDGRGRCMDNIFTERLWRSVKYEEVYLKSYQTIEEADSNLTAYFQFYNNQRRHQSLAYRTPREVYCGKEKNKISARADSKLTTGSLSILSTIVA